MRVTASDDLCISIGINDLDADAYTCVGARSE